MSDTAKISPSQTGGHQQQPGGASKPQRKEANKKVGSVDGSNSSEPKKNVLQQLKTVERVFRWPVIDSTWKQGIVVYDKIKGKLSLSTFKLLNCTFFITAKSVFLTRI